MGSNIESTQNIFERTVHYIESEIV